MVSLKPLFHLTRASVFGTGIAVPFGASLFFGLRL
tara:strand:- start:218 stop:322 length:105 start_codon:yes stop_codon:yes gene_type:complete